MTPLRRLAHRSEEPTTAPSTDATDTTDATVTDPGEGSGLPGVSRRAFFRVSGAAAAVAGMAAAVPGLGGLLAEADNDAPAAANTASEAGGDASGMSDLIAHVANPDTGELHLYFGQNQVVVRDPGLVSQLARAAGR